MPTERNPQRRRFLKTFGLGTVAAGAAVGIGPLTPVRADASSRDDTPHETPRGYRETAHIRAYYATLRD